MEKNTTTTSTSDSEMKAADEGDDGNEVVERELCVVEAPLFFYTEDKAKKVMRMFGGTKSLADIDQGKKSELKMYLRKSDLNCHPIEALPNRKKKKRIVVRMSKSSVGRVIRRAVVVGSVKTHFRFENPADFQIIGPSVDKTEGMETPWDFMKKKEEIRKNEGTSTAAPSPSVQIRGRSFTSSFRIPKYLFPAPPSFLMSGALRDTANKEKVAAAKKKVGRTKSNCVLEVDLFVEKLFKERPIFTAASIEARIQKKGLQVSFHRLMKKLLPRSASYIKDGPWGRTWCRKGYDLTKADDARYYQSFRFDLKGYLHTRTREERIAIKKRIKSENRSFLGLEVRLQSFFVLKDLLSFPEIERNVQIDTTSTAIDPKYGYFDKEFVSKLVGVMKHRFENEHGDLIAKSKPPSASFSTDATKPGFGVGGGEVRGGNAPGTALSLHSETVVPPSRHRSARAFHQESELCGTVDWANLNERQRGRFAEMASQDKKRYRVAIKDFCRRMVPKCVASALDEDDDSDDESSYIARFVSKRQKLVASPGPRTVVTTKPLPTAAASLARAVCKQMSSDEDDGGGGDIANGDEKNRAAPLVPTSSSLGRFDSAARRVAAGSPFSASSSFSLVEGAEYSSSEDDGGDDESGQ